MRPATFILDVILIFFACTEISSSSSNQPIRLVNENDPTTRITVTNDRGEVELYDFHHNHGTLERLNPNTPPKITYRSQDGSTTVYETTIVESRNTPMSTIQRMLEHQPRHSQQRHPQQGGSRNFQNNPRNFGPASQ